MRITLIALALITTLGLAACNKKADVAATSEMNDEQKTFYAVGQALAQQAKVFEFTPAEFEYVKRGMDDFVAGKKAVVEFEAQREAVQKLAEGRRKAAAEKTAGAGKAFLEAAAKEAGAETTPTGLIYRSTQEGKGENAKASDTVRVHYKGTLIDGTEFDSSFKRNEPAEFPLGGVIPCWTEGLQKMKPGGKAVLVCPSSIAYGEQGAGASIPPGATLKFEVELLDIVKT